MSSIDYERARLAADNSYWGRVTRIAASQTAKGVEHYGQILEQNTTLTDLATIIENIEEELVDALMYCEHLKENLKNDAVRDQ